MTEPQRAAYIALPPSGISMTTADISQATGQPATLATASLQWLRDNGYAQEDDGWWRRKAV